MGFDPMMQFIHEEDVCEAIALDARARAAGRLQRRRVRAGAAPHGDPRDRRQRAAAARVALRPSISTALFRLGLFAVSVRRDRLHQVPRHAVGAALRRGDGLPAALRPRGDLPQRAPLSVRSGSEAMARQRGLRALLGDLAGALTPLSVRDLCGGDRRSAPQGPDPAERVRLRRLRHGDRRRAARHAPVRVALPVLLPGREPRTSSASRRGRVLLISNHAGQLPFDAMMLGTAMLLEAEPPRIARGMAEYWIPQLPFVSVARRPQRRARRHARELRAAARGRRVRDGVSGGRARDEQALPRSLQAAALRAGLHAPRARDADADRARRRSSAPRSSSPGSPNLQRARPRCSACRRSRSRRPSRCSARSGCCRCPCQVPHLLRRAAALRGRRDRGGRGDRGRRSSEVKAAISALLAEGRAARRSVFF